MHGPAPALCAKLPARPKPAVVVGGSWWKRRDGANQGRAAAVVAERSSGAPLNFVDMLPMHDGSPFPGTYRIEWRDAV